MHDLGTFWRSSSCNSTTTFANMDRFASSSSDHPDTSANSRFTSQAATAEDLLKAQTVGLVNLNDYRKRRAEALDRKERGESAISSGASTPLEG
jgi:protein FAM50